MQNNNATVTVVFDPASPTSGIQEAIDALGKGGGCVRIPAGQWPLRQSIILSSQVQLVGDGPATQLSKTAPKVLRLSRDARKGSRSVHVRGKVPFTVGDGVAVVDDKRQWEIGTHAVVTAVESRLIRLSKPLVQGIKLQENARIVSVFPGITGPSYGLPVMPVYDVVVRDLALYGPNASVKQHYGDHTLSALHLCHFHRLRVNNVSIFDWLSDGVSIQGGADVQVTHCQVRGNSCMGFHPGGGLKRSIWSHNIGEGNRVDGLTVCWKVHDTVISDNVFVGNGRSGIGGLTYGDDHHNVISNNVCSANGHSGIWVDDLGVHPNANEKERGGHMITGNMLRNNSQADPGQWPALCLHNAHRFLVQGNSCADDQLNPTQTRGIVENGTSDWNLISGNMCVGIEEAITVVGRNSRAEGNLG